MTKPNYYAILSAEVRYDNNLRPNVKLLYAEITALCNTTGQCFATNRYFSNLYGKSKGTISGWISELVKYGYIKIEYTYKIGSKEIDHRYITILKGGVLENNNTLLMKTLKNNTTKSNTTKSNTNISIKQEDFEKSVKKSTNGYGYNIDLLDEFISYWTELNKSKTKMRFEMEKTFDVKRRLTRWQKNQKKWDKKNSKIDNQLNEYLKGKELL